jgi:hypothetical protein
MGTQVQPVANLIVHGRKVQRQQQQQQQKREPQAVSLLLQQQPVLYSRRLRTGACSKGSKWELKYSRWRTLSFTEEKFNDNSNSSNKNVNHRRYVYLLLPNNNHHHLLLHQHHLMYDSLPWS